MTRFPAILTASLLLTSFGLAVWAQNQPAPPDRNPPGAQPPPSGEFQPFDDGNRPPPPRGKGPKGPPGGPGQGPPGQPGDRPPPPPHGPGGPGGPPQIDWQRLEHDDPEMHALLMEDQKLDRETQELAHKCRQAKAEDREKLVKELGVKVNQHFDSRQKRRELQLKRMEEELARLREAIQSRNQTRDEVIKKRLAELVGPTTDLEF
jgi:hypothetical protein